MEYRKILESVSDKIIPVWHNNRGVEDFIEMCKKYKGKKIAITGFANNDIKDSQYSLFINTAHKYGCKIHILGLYHLTNNRNTDGYIRPRFLPNFRVKTEEQTELSACTIRQRKGQGIGILTDRSMLAPEGRRR